MSSPSGPATRAGPSVQSPQQSAADLTPERQPEADARLRPAAALRAALAAGYGWRDLRSDLLAGMVVGVVALPLSMALAIATGVPPQYGLYTAIVAGAVVALLGGSRVQVSGPTAAFVVVLAPIVTRFGLGGLLLASVLAGLLLVLMGIARLGRWIGFVPYPVITGFTAGIATVIATLQMQDFLGLTVLHKPDRFLERVAAMAAALPTVRWGDVSVGVFTLAALIGTPRLTRRIPAPLIAMPVATLLALAAAQVVPGFACDTISSRYGGVPQTPPQFVIPWAYPGPDGEPLALTLPHLETLLFSAMAIAILGAIESLLSATVAAAMSGTEYDPDAELIAQGTGNIVAPFFGGFAATGAIARTAANVRAGARSPLAAVAHAAFLLVGVLAAAPILGYLPMASMAALLLIVAWNMSEIRHVLHVLRVGPRGDALVLVTCFLLTVIFDMTIAVTVGIVLAALIFMRRMADVTGVRLVGHAHARLTEPLPQNVLLYEIAGPLFFGAAQRAMGALKSIASGVSVVVLDMRNVPTLDMTGLVNLESTLFKLHKLQVYTILAGVQEQPIKLMARAGWHHQDWMSVYRSFDHAIAVARDLAHLMPLGDRHATTAHGHVRQ
ncbi:MAG: C4-dicarboxylic acid transporter DauA [Phycisphaerae bacterium]|nr:C4-dicarboxylic acid transporter DauA [Phycisphaerae bacterium]